METLERGVEEWREMERSKVKTQPSHATTTGARAHTLFSTRASRTL